MAMDYKEFADKFQPENNPGKNPYSIRKNDTEVSLLYINQYGDEVTFTPCSFFHGRMWETLDDKHYEMAMDYPEFADTFQPWNNPGKNPITIRKWDNVTELYHINQYGVKIPYTPHKFFIYRLWVKFPYMTGKMAMDYLEFSTRFQQENNPGVNPYTIGKWDKEPELYHINQHGFEISYTAFNFFNNRMWETMDERGAQDNRRYEMAMDYEEFREIFQPENNPGVDPYTLRKWDKEKHLIYINPYGVEIPYTTDRFFRRELWKTMPFRKYVRGKLVNALELDDEIAMYVRNKEELQSLLETRLSRQMAFQCPFCHSEFTKKLKEMINAPHKCPFCEDTGMYKEISLDEDINGSFLKRD